MRYNNKFWHYSAKMYWVPLVRVLSRLQHEYNVQSRRRFDATVTPNRDEINFSRDVKKVRRHDGVVVIVAEDVGARAQEAASLHQTAAGRAGTRLHHEHLHHETDPLGSVAAARPHRTSGEDLVSEPSDEGQEAGGEEMPSPLSGPLSWTRCLISPGLCFSQDSRSVPTRRGAELRCGVNLLL